MCNLTKIFMPVKKKKKNSCIKRNYAFHLDELFKTTLNRVSNWQRKFPWSWTFACKILRTIIKHNYRLKTKPNVKRFKAKNSM